MRDYERTTGRVIAGQPMPKPVRPPGDGWLLLSTIPGEDTEGNPVLMWTWYRELNQQEAPEEDLVQERAQ